ncbi:MAG: glycosyltransferase [Planctomycetes bacterium]|nr:glycosyltransferase [Planctomycetota bacterium]
MRVDHAIVNVTEPANGVAEFVRGLAVAEAGAGVDVHVHAIRPPVHLPGVATNFYQPNAYWPSSTGTSSALSRGVEEAARAAGVLHVHNLWSGMAMSMPLAACGENRQIVWSLHGALHPGSLAVSRLKKRLVWMVVQRSLIGRSDLLHATSIEELAHCREAGLRMPVVVVPAGVEIPATTGPPGNGHQQRRVGFAGRLHRVKALDRLIAAWKAIATRHRDWVLSIRGPDGGVGDAIGRLASEVPRVEIGPVIARGERAAWYHSCDLVVLPSHAENFGLVVAESLAHGVPVIAGTGTPWQKVIQKGCGWWIPNDVDSLAATLDAAMSLPAASLTAMGGAGRQWMIDEYAWPMVAERMIAAYRWLTGEGPWSPDIYR